MFEKIKENCVSCGKPLKAKNRYFYYRKNGNYCRDCIKWINEMFLNELGNFKNIFPGEKKEKL
jgi:formamidopyrimidine-DNA glycosylase